MNHFVVLSELEMSEPIKDAFLGSAQTENLTVAYTDMKAGVTIPLHHHTEEAVDIVLEGTLQMQIGEKSDTLSPGMISIVPSHIMHQARAITDCKVVTVFYPQRKI
jgi:quercetin dioxygenase-like cupin family protein